MQSGLPDGTLAGMDVETHKLRVATHGHSHVVNVTDGIEEKLQSGSIRNGLVTAFVIGSTAGLTTTEFEPGLAEHDLEAAFEKLAPAGGHYAHEATWNDDNGHSHVRASLLGPSLTVPLVDGRLTLGTWQQIVLVDFDTQPRERVLMVQVLGNA